MALIQCPECGKEISDKVTACPHCGYPLAEQPQPASPQPVEVTGINLSAKNPKKSKKILVCAVIIVFVIAAVGIGFTVKKSNDAKQAANEYIDNLGSVRLLMLSGAAEAEKLCILTHDVWYNTIYEESDPDTDKYTKNSYSSNFHDDFNDSLVALYLDQSTKDMISEINSNRESVDELIKQLQNPTDDFSACYATVDAMYDAYCGLTNLATSPTGSLQSYSESYRTYDGDFLKYYEKLETQIPEKQE